MLVWVGCRRGGGGTSSRTPCLRRQEVHPISDAVLHDECVVVSCGSELTFLTQVLPRAELLAPFVVCDLGWLFGVSL